MSRLESEVKAAEKAAYEAASSESSSKESSALMGELETAREAAKAATKRAEAAEGRLRETVESQTSETEAGAASLAASAKELSLYRSRVEEQRVQLEETRKARDEAREELSRWQQTWARERSELAHKLRQDEKVQAAEQQAMQLKYENRIKVMEESSRRTQSQVPLPFPTARCSALRQDLPLSWPNCDASGTSTARTSSHPSGG